MAPRARPVRVVSSKASAAKALAAAIAASTRTSGGTACRVCTLPPAIRAVVEQTLATPASDRRVSLVQLSALLKQQGHTVGAHSLQKHGTRHLGR
jgi:hypothetical protein